MGKLIFKNKSRIILNFLLMLIYGYVMLVIGTNAYSLSNRSIGFFVLISTLIATFVIGMAWHSNINVSLIADNDVSVKNKTKRKRQAIDDVLQDLSDDDLLALRQRLQERSIDEDELYGQFVGDDGELVNRY